MHDTKPMSNSYFVHPRPRARPALCWAGASVLAVLVACTSGPGIAEVGSSTGSETEQGTTDASSTGSSTTGISQYPLGEVCTEPQWCASEVCWTWILPEHGIPAGTCSECASDDECEGGGCQMPLTFPFDEDAPPGYATCNTGQLGERCMSAAACEGDLVCATLVPYDGVIWPLRVCSLCDEDADCGDQLCSPTWDAQTGGHTRCVQAGTVPLGGGCDVRGSGDLACASGYCRAHVFSVPDEGLTLGICSECDEDPDCAEQERCVSFTGEGGFPGRRCE